MNSRWQWGQTETKDGKGSGGEETGQSKRDECFDLTVASRSSDPCLEEGFQRIRGVRRQLKVCGQWGRGGRRALAVDREEWGRGKATMKGSVLTPTTQWVRKIIPVLGLQGSG